MELNHKISKAKIAQIASTVTVTVTEVHWHGARQRRAKEPLTVRVVASTGNCRNSTGRLIIA
jgi:hypothetical protein